MNDPMLVFGFINSRTKQMENAIMSRRTSFILTLSWLLLFSSNLLAQDAESLPTTPPSEAVISVAALEDELNRVESTTDLDEETKKKATELLKQAIDQAKKAAAFQTQLANSEAAVKTIASRGDALKKRAKEFKEAAPPKMDPTAKLPELEVQLTQIEQRANELREKVNKADSEISTRATRLKAIRDRLPEAKQLLDEATKQVVVSGDTELLAAAKRFERTTQRQMLRAEISSLEAELALLDAENVADIPRLRREDAVAELAAVDRELQVIQDTVRKGRDDEAKRQLEATQSEAKKETNPLLRPLADRNVDLAKQRQELNGLITTAKKTLKDTQAIRDDWKKEAETTKSQVDTIGLTNTTGTMLRQQKLKLPDPNFYSAKVAEGSSLVNEAQLEWMKLEEERSRDLDETIRRDDTLEPPTSPQVRDEALALIEKRNELLGPLARAQNDYFQTLVELSNAEQQIANQLKEYEAFIDERILWVRSSAPLLSSFEFDRSDLWLLDRSRWQKASQTMLADLGEGLAWYLVAGLGLIVLIRNRLIFRKRIREYGEVAESGSCTQFAPTVQTLLLTIVAALPWPALLAFLSWRLSLNSEANEITRALTRGLWSVAVAYFPLEFVRLACRPRGLAESHLGWPSNSVQMVRRHLRAIMLICLPLLLLTSMLSSSTSGLGRDTFERLTFIAVTIVLSYFLSRVLHPASGAFSGYLAKNAGGWISRLQPIWYWLIVLSPLVLTGLVIFGYYYTAQQLAWRFYATACLLGGVFIATAFISRLLLVQRRRLSIEQARQRRAAQLQASQDETAAAVIAEELPSAEDLRAQISQSQSLLRTVMVGVALAGIWIAWVDVLPALGFLEQWPLWESTVQKSEMITDDAGDVTFKTRDVIDPVTIADIVLSLVILTITLVSARNIPGVLEISILQRLPIEASIRYAITTIVSYLIVLVGLIVACGKIGIHWNQVQWLATALTFGLAFGLQEMFANFVAGIIILFERPIRVGDIVTVDDVSGTVSRVKIRATTITNWDRKDYVVPNKDFITGRVLNWTLSDQFNRIVVNVGVAYGSDTEKTIENILCIAEEHPMVVDDPKPIVTFEEFGSSSLNFTLRCFIAMKDMPSRLDVIHQLHMGIDKAFREAKIEIAFPQQDIHIRSTPEAQQSLVDAFPSNGSKTKAGGRTSSTTDDPGE